MAKPGNHIGAPRNLTTAQLYPESPAVRLAQSQQIDGLLKASWKKWESEPLRTGVSAKHDQRDLDAVAQYNAELFARTREMERCVAAQPVPAAPRRRTRRRLGFLPA